jgi:phage-related protein
MAITTLTIYPAWGADLSEEPRVNEAVFGDGYSQRITQGINNIRGEIDAAWGPIGQTDADALVALFRTLNGVSPFQMQMPGDSMRKFITVGAWKKKFKDTGVFEVSVKLKQVFDA